MTETTDWPEECTMICQKCGERLLLWDAEGKPHQALPIPVTCTPCSLKEFGHETTDLPDLWDAEATQKWLENRMDESLRSILNAHDGLTSRFCEICFKAYFFQPKKPTGCPHCSKAETDV